MFCMKSRLWIGLTARLRRWLSWWATTRTRTTTSRTTCRTERRARRAGADRIVPASMQAHACGGCKLRLLRSAEAPACALSTAPARSLSSVGLDCYPGCRRAVGALQLAASKSRLACCWLCSRRSVPSSGCRCGSAPAGRGEEGGQGLGDEHVVPATLGHLGPPDGAAVLAGASPS